MNGAGKPATRRIGKMTITPTSDLEVEITRVFDAPRDLVFDAHSKPEHIRRWWGPARHTMTTCEMDFRPGGRWRFVLRDADGHEYAFRGEYREIAPPERIAWTFEFEGMPGAIMQETIRFVEQAGRTTIISTSRFDSIEARDGLLQGDGMAQGAAETYDRLEEHLRAMTRAQP
jgi:uncharacterized protein YndB with AHSA1/START domain